MPLTVASCFSVHCRNGLRSYSHRPFCASKKFRHARRESLTDCTNATLGTSARDRRSLAAGWHFRDLMFVTDYRRRVFSTPCSPLRARMRGVCAELDSEVVEFIVEADNLLLLVAFPTIFAISSLCSGSTPAPPIQPAGLTAPVCAYTNRRRPTSPSPAEVYHRRPLSSTSTAKHAS
jgi:hypothetical protein